MSIFDSRMVYSTKDDALWVWYEPAIQFGVCLHLCEEYVTIGLRIPFLYLEYSRDRAKKPFDPGIPQGEKAESRKPDSEYDPEWPLWHRTDLPKHERGISREAYEALQTGLASAKERLSRGEPAGTPMDWSLLAPEDDDEGEGGGKL